jgi:acyl-coenzyme A thioesterase PaaI-like protein
MADSSVRYAMWFAVSATVAAVGLTATVSFVEARAERPQIPRAIARRPRRETELYN